ncbi:MAG: methyltransferase domain-containing protein [Bacteroidota bacterium]
MQTQRRQFNFGTLAIQLDTIQDTEALLDDLIARDDNDPEVVDEVMPYWADLWHSALALSEFITEQRDTLPGLRVLEIGCGLGLPGIVASGWGARVTFSDYVHAALDFAAHNLRLNQPDHAATFTLLDWRNPPQDQQYDLILAADVAYEKRFFAPLYQSLHTLLKPTGQCWLSEPGRPIAASFMAGLEEAGLSIEKEDFKVAKLDEVQRKVRILTLKKTQL